MLAAARGGLSWAAEAVPRLAALGAGVVIAKAQTAGSKIILFLSLFGFAAILDAHLLGALIDLLLCDLPQLIPLIVALSLGYHLLLNAAVVLFLLILDKLLEHTALFKLLSGDDRNLRHGRQ